MLSFGWEFVGEHCGARIPRKKRPESGKPRKQPSLTMDQHLSAVSGCNSFGWLSWSDM